MFVIWIFGNDKHIRFFEFDIGYLEISYLNIWQSVQLLYLLFEHLAIHCSAFNMMNDEYQSFQIKTILNIMFEVSK